MQLHVLKSTDFPKSTDGGIRIWEGTQGKGAGWGKAVAGGGEGREAGEVSAASDEVIVLCFPCPWGAGEAPTPGGIHLQPRGPAELP